MKTTFPSAIRKTGNNANGCLILEVAKVWTIFRMEFKKVFRTLDNCQNNYSQLEFFQYILGNN